MSEKTIVDVPLTPRIVSVNIKDSEVGVLELDEFPEGGWRAWSCVAGAFCLQMVGFGLTGSYGVYQDYYTRVYMTKEDPSAISWIGSVCAFIVTVLGVVSGRLYDKGYFYHILYGGSALLVFSLFMLSLCEPNHIYQNFLAQGVGQGLGAGLTYVPSLAVVSQYFFKKRALAMSIVAAGSSLGAIIHPIMLNNLFLKLGYGNAVRANAGMNAGLLIIACLLLRTRLPPPETVPPFWKSVKTFSRDLPYVFCVIGLMTMPFAVFFPIFYIQLDAVKQGLSQNFAFYSLVILNGVSIFGRLAPGILSRFISVPMLTITCTFGCAALIYAMSGITTVAAFVIFGILFGFFAGAFIALMAPLTTIFARDTSEIGLRMGVAFALYGLGTLAGPPIQGALLGKSYTWWKPAVFSGSFALLGTVMFGIMIILLRRRKESPIL